MRLDVIWFYGMVCVHALSWARSIVLGPYSVGELNTVATKGFKLEGWMLNALPELPENRTCKVANTNKLLDFAASCQFANLRCAQRTLLKSQCNHVQPMKLSHHLPSFQDPVRHWAAPQTSDIKWDARECHDTLPVTRWRASAAYVGTWPRASRRRRRPEGLETGCKHA